jgi:hypothetical protein
MIPSTSKTPENDENAVVRPSSLFTTSDAVDALFLMFLNCGTISYRGREGQAGITNLPSMAGSTRSSTPTKTLLGTLCAPMRAVSERNARERNFMADAEEKNWERAEECVGGGGNCRLETRSVGLL